MLREMNRKSIYFTIFLVLSIIYSQVSFVSPVIAAAKKPANTISVKDYGAKGDGRTDDSSAIQKALNQAEKISATVYFPKGTYVVHPSRTLYVGSKTNLIGDGADTVIRASSSSFGWELMRVDGSDVTINNLVLDGNNRVNRILAISGGNSNITISQIKAVNATHSTDAASDFYSGVVSGIIIYGDTNSIRIDQVEVGNVQAINKQGGSLVARGIYITTIWGSKEAAARQVSITNSYIHHIGPADDGDGIYYEDPNLDKNKGRDTNSVIAGNRFDHNAKRAIKIYAQGITVKDNQIDNSYLNNNYYNGAEKGKLAPDMYSAISVYGSNNTIDNNTIKGIGSFYAAIEVSADETLKNIKIINNSITMGERSNISGKTAIRLGNITDFTVSANTIQNGEKAIWTWQNASDGLINKNKITMKQGGGIDLSSYVTNVTQKNIICEDNQLLTTTFGIQLAKSNDNVKVSQSNSVGVMKN